MALDIARNPFGTLWRQVPSGSQDNQTLVSGKRFLKSVKADVGKGHLRYFSHVAAGGRLCANSSKRPRGRWAFG